MTGAGFALWTLDGITVVAAGFAIRSAVQAVRSARRVREIRRGRP